MATIVRTESIPHVDHQLSHRMGSIRVLLFLISVCAYLVNAPKSFPGSIFIWWMIGFRLKQFYIIGFNCCVDVLQWGQCILKNTQCTFWTHYLVGPNQSRFSLEGHLSRLCSRLPCAYLNAVVNRARGVTPRKKCKWRLALAFSKGECAFGTRRLFWSFYCHADYRFI